MQLSTRPRCSAGARTRLTSCTSSHSSICVGAPTRCQRTCVVVPRFTTSKASAGISPVLPCPLITPQAGPGCDAVRSRPFLHNPRAGVGFQYEFRLPRGRNLAQAGCLV